MADEILRSKHGFGSLGNVAAALQSGKIDKYDILFLDGDTEPKIGWIDKDDNFRLVKSDCVVAVDELPLSGVKGKVYIFNDEGYFWNGQEFVNFCKPTDVTGLESRITALETALGKINTTVVDLQTEVANVKTDISDVKEDVTNLKTDVSDVKTEVDNVKTDVSDVKTDVANLKTDVDNVKEDVTNLKTDVSDVKEDIANLDTKVSNLESVLDSGVSDLQAEIEKKANIEDVQSDIEQAKLETIGSAKTYTDGKVEAAVKEHLVKKFEISDTPKGTIVNVNEREIRVMCPVNTDFVEQSVGTNGDPNCYYMTLKTYVFDDNVVGYREHLGAQSDNETLTDLRTDEFGRRYQLTWLALAKYDDATGMWNYYGKNSSVNKYVGWDYKINWYNADDEIVSSDCIRINLSNEECHFVNEPYYVGNIMKEIDTKIEEKISEVEAAYEVIEF